MFLFWFPQEIDDYIVQAKERGYETMVNFGRQGLNLAATAAVTAAVKVIFFMYLFLSTVTLNLQIKKGGFFVLDHHKIVIGFCMFILIRSE